jgi:hypothetical protein
MTKQKFEKLPSTAGCKACGRIISGNKKYCAAHIPGGEYNRADRVPIQTTQEAAR